MIDNSVSNIVIFYVFRPFSVDYNAHYSYTNKDFVNEPIIKVEEIMARKQDDTLLTEQELAAAFIDDDNDDLLPGFNDDNSRSNSTPTTRSDDNWEDEADDAMGQLAVTFFETENNLVIKARTAGEIETT